MEAGSQMVEDIPLDTMIKEKLLKCKQILQKWNAESNRQTLAHIKRNMKRIASLQEEGTRDHICIDNQLQEKVEV